MHKNKLLCATVVLIVSSFNGLHCMNTRDNQVARSWQLQLSDYRTTSKERYMTRHLQRRALVHAEDNRNLLTFGLKTSLITVVSSLAFGFSKDALFQACEKNNRPDLKWKVPVYSLGMTSLLGVMYYVYTFLESIKKNNERCEQLLNSLEDTIKNLTIKIK
jgi:hypothetical protein